MKDYFIPMFEADKRNFSAKRRVRSFGLAKYNNTESHIPKVLLSESIQDSLEGKAAYYNALKKELE